MSKPAIAFCLDFYNGNAQPLADDSVITYMTFDQFRHIAEFAATHNMNYFNNLQDKAYFSNTKATPGILYDLSKEDGHKWRFSINGCEKSDEFFAIPATKYAPNEPQIIVSSYDFSYYINKCMENPRNNYMKQCAFTYAVDKKQVIIIMTAINTEVNNEVMPEEDKKKLRASQAVFKEKAFAQFKVNQKQFGEEN